MIEHAEHQLRDQGDCNITLPKNFCLGYHQSCEWWLHMVRNGPGWLHFQHRWRHIYRNDVATSTLRCARIQKLEFGLVIYTIARKGEQTINPVQRQSAKITRFWIEDGDLVLFAHWLAILQISARKAHLDTLYISRGDKAEPVGEPGIRTGQASSTDHNCVAVRLEGKGHLRKWSYKALLPVKSDEAPK